VFDRIEVCDRRLASVRYQAPFDLLSTWASSKTMRWQPTHSLLFETR